MSNPQPSTVPPPTDPRPALVPVGRYDSRPSFSLDRPVTLIGSRQRADIRLESDEVSRSHAVIINTGGRVVIRDLASRTHVYVNGRQVHEAQLADGDHVNIGRFMLRFAAGDSAPSGVRTAHVPRIGGAILTGDGLKSGGVALNGTPCVVGCRKGVDVMLDGQDVSFAHALIFNDGERYAVQDLGSRTGTFVDGRRVDGHAELRPGSLIRIGSYRIRYSAVAAGPMPVQDVLPALAVPGHQPAAVAEPSASLAVWDQFGESPADPTTAPVNRGHFAETVGADPAPARAAAVDVEELAPLAPAEPSPAPPSPAAIEVTFVAAIEVAAAEVIPVQGSADPNAAVPDPSHFITPELKTTEPEHVDALPVVDLPTGPGPDGTECVEAVAAIEAARLDAVEADGADAQGEVDVFVAPAIPVEAPVFVCAPFAETPLVPAPVDGALNTPELVAPASQPAVCAPDPAEESDACAEFGVVLDAAAWRHVEPDRPNIAPPVPVPPEVVEPSRDQTDRPPDAPPDVPASVPEATDAVTRVPIPQAPPGAAVQVRSTSHADLPAPPPAKWGMLAAAVALAEMPHALPPDLPDAGADHGPRRRGPRLLMLVAAVIVLTTIAGAAFLFFNPAAADVLRGYL